jgi:hypothetical protein
MSPSGLRKSVSDDSNAAGAATARSTGQTGSSSDGGASMFNTTKPSEIVAQRFARDVEVAEATQFAQANPPPTRAPA